MRNCAVDWLLHGKSKSSLGAHSRAEFTTAKAAAPNATVKPMTASRMKRRAVGWTTATVLRWASRVRCCCSIRLRRSTVSGRCWVDANSKSLKVETAVLDKREWLVRHFCCEKTLQSKADRLTADCALWPAQMEETERTDLPRGWSASRTAGPLGYETGDGASWPCHTHSPTPPPLDATRSAERKQPAQITQGRHFCLAFNGSINIAYSK